MESNGDESRFPRCFVLVFLVKLVQVHDDVAAILAHGVTIETASGASAVLDVDAVGREARMMLRALELAVLVIPAKRRVLVRAGESVYEHLALPPRDHRVVVLVDLGA